MPTRYQILVGRIAKLQLDFICCSSNELCKIILHDGCPRARGEEREEMGGGRLEREGGGRRGLEVLGAIQFWEERKGVKKG